MKSEFLRIAEQLLEKHREPMSARRLVDLAKDEGLFSDKFVGKTPHQTMKSKLSVHVRRNGNRSIFVRTKPGRFYLRRLLDSSQIVYEAPPLQAPPAMERVLVFPSRWLDKNDYRFQGISSSWKRLASRLLGASICTYCDRLRAEADEECKQILTYIMVTRGPHVLAFKRGTFNRVEDYLRGSHCVGFGGHVSEVDNNLFTSDFGVLDNAVRELFEELRLPKKDRERLRSLEGLEIVGTLNDDSSATGRRHFAFILRYEVSDDPFWIKPERGEKSITQLRWLDPTSAAFSIRDFEYWSQLCLREYYSSVVMIQPSYIVQRRAPLKPPHVLCVLGPLGSGKSEATRVLTKEFGYVEVNSGKVIAEILGIPPVPCTDRETFQQLAWTFISTEDGPQHLARAIALQVERLRGDRVLVDGIRQQKTLNELAQLNRDRHLGLLFVHTPADIAYKFYKKRSGADFTIHDFLKVYDSPVEGEVRKMIGRCDAVLYNWMGRDMYRKAIRGLMCEVGTEPTRSLNGRWL
jgi:predicted NUDIX family phosphoesterase